MSRRDKRVLILAAVVLASIIVGTVWFAHGATGRSLLKMIDMIGEEDVAEPPPVFESVGAFPTEAMPFYDGDEWYVKYLSLGRPQDVAPVGDVVGKKGMPPLVSPRACRARFSDEGSQSKQALVQFFLDESGGEGAGYDRLYADRNADGVYERSESVGLLADLPAGAVVKPPQGCEYLVFEPFDLRIGSTEPPRPVVARLLIGVDGVPTDLYIRESLRSARVTLGGRDCRVILIDRFPGGYDKSLTHMAIEYGPGQLADCYPPDALCSVNGHVYRVSASSRGETLSVEEYVGEAGTIAIDMDGGWKGATVRQIWVKGESRFLMAFGAELEERGEFAVPVGGYHPVWVWMTKGRSGCCMTNFEDHAANHAKPVDVSGGGRALLTLTQPPEVVFAEPAKGASIRRGDEIPVMAYIQCTEWVLRGVSVSTLSEDADGDSPYKAVRPQVVVSDSEGNVIAQGPLPSGPKRLRADAWCVPEDAKVGETLTIEVTYDTGELWGTITGSREVIVGE